MNSIIEKSVKSMQVMGLLFLVALSAGAQNLTGRIICDGRGVKDVVVSDGDEVTLTDREGYYALQSQKRNGYVFYTLPRGYEPELLAGFNPQFWAALNTPDLSATEVHDFRLKKVKNVRDGLPVECSLAEYRMPQLLFVQFGTNTLCGT